MIMTFLYIIYKLLLHITNIEKKIFFRLLFHCDDHFFIFISFLQFIYDLFHNIICITNIIVHSLEKKITKNIFCYRTHFIGSPLSLSKWMSMY